MTRSRARHSCAAAAAAALVLLALTAALPCAAAQEQILSDGTDVPEGTLLAPQAAPRPSDDYPTLGQAVGQAMGGDTPAARAFRARAVRRGKAQSSTPGKTDANTTLQINVNDACPLLRTLSVFSRAQACQLVAQVEKNLLGGSHKCSNPKETGYGKQKQPIATAKDGSPAPRPLTPRQPGAKTPDDFPAAQVSTLLGAEGATFNWLWTAGRNLVDWWPCSKEFGGSLTGYLIPTGWDAVQVAGMMPGNPGVYTLAEADGKSYPIMVMLKQKSSNQLVVIVRGTGTAEEWRLDFQYNRVAGAAFSGTPFSGSSFPGETHSGFTKMFNALWPRVQAAMDAHVVAGDKITSVTVAGHSLGSAVATLLAYGAQSYADAKRPGAVSVGLVASGPPNVGNTAFRLEMAKKVNSRRIAFENDLISKVPCSSFILSFSASMPACSAAQVPVATNMPASKTYWVDYQPIPGTMAITSSMFPVQSAAWGRTNKLLLQGPSSKDTSGAAHVCSYKCIVSQYSKGETDNNCLLENPPVAGSTFCPGFPKV